MLGSSCSLCAWYCREGLSDCGCFGVQVRELCAYVEKAHGMSQGWLLSAPQARVSVEALCNSTWQSLMEVVK